LRMERCQVEAWLGSIPVSISLAREEVVGTEAPAAYETMLARTTYLPTLAAELASHFGEVTTQLSYGLPRSEVKRVEEEGALTAAEKRWAPVWFSSENQTVGWEYPVGVSYDLLGGERLPWRLVAHFSKFPDDALALVTADTCERTFFHSLKQAVHLETGTARAALGMPRVQQAALWDAVCRGDRAAFIANDVAKHDSPLETPPRAVPVRLVLARDGRRLQLPHAAYDAAGRKRTVRETVLDRFEAHAAKAHGVHLSPDLPLIDAWKALAHPDHFLYVLLLDAGPVNAGPAPAPPKPSPRRPAAALTAPGRDTAF